MHPSPQAAFTFLSIPWTCGPGDRQRSPASAHQVASCDGDRIGHWIPYGFVQRLISLHPVRHDWGTGLDGSVLFASVGDHEPQPDFQRVDLEQLH